MNLKFTIFSFLFGLIFINCQPQIKEINIGGVELPKMVYPKYRKWMSPDNGDLARFKSPSLQWPSRNSKNYQLRLSTDKDFTEDLISIEDIPFSFINIHKPLKNGLWYWQYRSTNGNWSEIASFKVDNNSIDFVPPSFETLINSIPKSHPRVMVKKEKWDEVSLKSTSYKESKKIIEQADKIISRRIPSERDAQIQFEGRDAFETEKIKKNFSQKVGSEFGKSLNILTKAYVLSKNDKYYTSAIKWMREAITWDPRGLTRINDFGDAMIMQSLATSIDVFWERISEKDKIDVLNQIVTRGEGFYNHWTGNYSLANRNSSMHVWQHILHNLFLTSITLIDEVPEASKWLKYIYELWLAQHPKMAENDGAWFNGTGYMRMNVMTLLDIPYKLGEYTGVNFFGVPWYGNFMKWLTYAYPPGATSDGFCNDGKKWPIPNLEYAAFSDAYARITGDQMALKYSRSVLAVLKEIDEPIIDLGYTGGAIEKADLSDDLDYAWFRITSGYEMPLPIIDDEIELNDAEIFPDVGVAYMNSNRKDIKNNLRISIKSSPMGPLAHTHAEHNTFNIAFKGKRLFYNSGYRPWMGAPHTQAWYKHTQGHNGILVDQKGQLYDAGAYGFIPRFINGESLSYAVGDASHAYQAHELSMKARKDNTPNDMEVNVFRRHYILLKPNIFIVYDELESKSPVDWSWLIHNYDGLKLNSENKSVETTYSDKGGRVTLFGSSDLDYSVTDKFLVEPKNFIGKKDPYGNLLTYKNHWHFKATTKEKQKKMRFLAIVQVSDDLNYDAIALLKQGKFEINEWTIQANLDISTPGYINIINEEIDLQFQSNVSNEYDVSKLIEIINGEKIIKTASDSLPASIISASKRINE